LAATGRVPCRPCAHRWSGDNRRMSRSETSNSAPNLDLVALSKVLGVPPELLTSAKTEPIGTGQIADSFRLRFDSQAIPNGLPPSLVVKCTSPDETSQASAKLLNLYTKEVGWYRELQPRSTARVPRSFGSTLSDDGGEFILALEDCAPARQGNQLDGADATLLKLALTEAARLHAPFLGDEATLGQEWLQTDPDTQAMIRGLLAQFWPPFKDRYQDRLEAELFELGDAFVEKLLSMEELPPELQTVTHGDFRIDNMMFGHPEGRAVILDWQTIAPGHPLSDVSYLLGTSIADVDERRAIEQGLVHHYVEEMASHGAALDWQDAWQAYRRYAGNGFVMAVTASMLAKRTARGDEMFAVMAERPARQMIDLDTLALL